MQKSLFSAVFAAVRPALPRSWALLRPAGACLLLCLYWLSQAAAAHAHLEQAQPAADSKNPEVRDIRLVFNEAVEPRLSTIQIEDREDHAVVEPAAEPDPADRKVLTLHLFEKLPTGSYTVRWAAVAADGHRVRGSYSFIVSH